VRRGALVALGACLLATLAPSATSAKEATGVPLTELRAVLRVRVDAHRGNDRDAFARTIDPNAPTTFRDAQLRSFDNLATLPVARINYSIRADETDLTRAVSKAEYGDATVALVPTTRALRFTYDARSAIDSMFWTFVKRGDAWFVGGDDDVADLGLETTVSMWDTGPVVVEQTEHFQFVAHPEQRARARELANLAEQANATLAPRWTLPWSDKMVGFLPATPDELADLIQASVDVTKFVAFVAYGYDSETLRSTAPRLFIQDRNLSVYPAAAQIETLVHELTHAAGSAYAGPFIPAWVHEGLADWIAIGPTNRFPRGSGAGARAPRDDEFGAGSQAQIVRAYRDSRSLIAALSRIAGPQAPFTLFQTIGGYKVRAGSNKYLADEGLRALGLSDLAALERDWVAGK
jgi:hypothetical protein